MNDMTWIMLCKSILLIEIFRLNITQCKQRINRGVVIRGRYGIMNVHVILGKASTRGNMKIPGNLIHLKGSGEITPLMTLAQQGLLVTVPLVSIAVRPRQRVFAFGVGGWKQGSCTVLAHIVRECRSQELPTPAPGTHPGHPYTYYNTRPPLEISPRNRGHSNPLVVLHLERSHLISVFPSPFRFRLGGF